MTDQTYFTRQEAAEYLRVSEETIKRSPAADCARSGPATTAAAV